jgi:hypothetical protein
VSWNANGLSQHTAKVNTFIQNQKADVMLISETHFTIRIYIKILNYTIYDTQHPDGTVHGGTAIIMKTSIEHHLHEHYNLEHLQANSVTIEDWIGPLTIAAVYCPKHSVQAEQFRSLYTSLVHRFLEEGDYNGKHSHWGAGRLTTPERRELFKAMQAEILSHVSTDESIYWSSDGRKVPGLVEFGVPKRIPVNSLLAESSFDLSWDHSPVIVTIIQESFLNPAHQPSVQEQRNRSQSETILGKILSSMYPSGPT